VQVLPNATPSCLPSNLTTASRSRKIKCIVETAGGKCERCEVKGIECSYAPERPSEPDNVASHVSTRPLQPQLPPQYAAGFSQGTNQHRYRLRHEYPGLDIGTGKATEILREGEFAQSLLLLYFHHFGDVHFMFDESVLYVQTLPSDSGRAVELLLASVLRLDDFPNRADTSD
jgi:hypothetical protein